MDEQDKRDGIGSLDRSGHMAGNTSTVDLDKLDPLLAQLAAESSTRRAPSSVRQRLQAEARRHTNPPFWQAVGFSATRTWSLAVGITLFAAAVTIGSLFLSPSKLIHEAHFAFFSYIHRSGSPPKAGDSVDSAQARNREDFAASSYDTFSVPYSDPSIANGTGATVRVSLPNSELLAWGVPSFAREPDDLVPVDLTLGDDGLPQSVRLLPAATSTSEEIYP